MPFHFDTTEFATRQSTAREALQSEGLDALLIFAPESQYWLCGYDTFGYAMFQCLVLSATGDLHLLTRLPDLRQAQQSSTLPHDHIHVWAEHEGANPANALRDLLADLGLANKTLGYECRRLSSTSDMLATENDSDSLVVTTRRRALTMDCAPSRARTRGTMSPRASSYTVGDKV